MKVEFRFLLEKISGLLIQPFKFRVAVGLSLVLHLFLFFALGRLVALLDSHIEHERPIVFDFIYRPSAAGSSNLAAVDDVPIHKISSQSSRNVSASDQANVKQEGAAKPSEVNFNNAQAATSQADVQRIDKNEVANTLFPGVADNSDAIQEASLSRSYDKNENRVMAAGPVVEPVVSTRHLQRFVRPRGSDSRRPAPSVKMEMSNQARKMLKKKARKWTEDYYKMASSDSTLTWKHKGRLYTARFRHYPAQSNTDIERVEVTVETEDDGAMMKTKMRMKRLSFSNFAQFVDQWNPWVAVHDDELIGRFHANSKINIISNRGVKPKFHGKVTTASYDVNTNESRPFFDTKSVFLGGLETGVKAIKLPRALLPATSSEITVDDAFVHVCEGDTRIVFHADGTFSWESIGGEQASGRVALPKEAFYIVGDKKKRLHIRGIVKGSVLVYSPQKIIIDGDLTYARHPDISNIAEDYLGIVCDKNIEIAHPSVTGPGDLRIYASVFARGRFLIKNLYGNGEATLRIYGSLTAGSLSATEPRYATHIQFDKRLENNRPPDFPMTDRYEVSDWDAKWEIGGSKE